MYHDQNQSQAEVSNQKIVARYLKLYIYAFYLIIK